jgi:pyrroloquinoline-quinone synthase
VNDVLDRAAFIERMREEGARRYHDRHPFHARMHAGTLTRDELRAWVVNRYYYQTRIPLKDALIVAKAEDREFRRTWIRRIHDQDGDDMREGGLAMWWQLAAALDIDRDALEQHREVLPGVRLACDSYVSFVREASLVEAVASSLTEWFAPDLMRDRIEAWEQHYPWIPSEALTYFRIRVPRARHDSDHALGFVLINASTRDLQDRCIAALVRKTEILWHLLDCIEMVKR